MSQPAMPGVKREAAEPVKDWLTLVDLDRQRIVRAMADDEVGAGIDRSMGNLAHVLQNLPADAPVAGGNDNVGLCPQCGDVFGKPLQILLVGPGQDLRGQTGSVG